MSTEALFDSFVELFPRAHASAPTALSGAFGIRDVVSRMRPNRCELSRRLAAAGAWFAPHVPGLRAGAELSTWLTETLVGAQVGNRVVVCVGKHGRARLYRVDKWPGPGPVGDSPIAGLVGCVGERWTADSLILRATRDATVFDLLSKLCGFSAIVERRSLAQWLDRRIGRVCDGFELVMDGDSYMVALVGKPVAAITKSEAPKRETSESASPDRYRLVECEVPSDNSDLL